MAFKRSGVRFSYAPQKSLSEWSEGDFSCLVAPIMITAKIGWRQEGRTDFSSASRARITGRPAMPISRVVWSRRRCEQPDSAVAAQTKQHTCLCRCSETAILARNSVAAQTQQGNGQCRGRERIPNPEPEMHLSHQRGSHGKAIVRFIRFVLLSICIKRQR